MATRQTITVAPVDVSISLQTSRLAVALNDTVGFRLLVRNKSGCDAGSIGIQSRLPPNLTFVSATNPLRLLNNIVSGTITGLSAGATVSQYYIARVTTAGTYRTTAEITSTVNPDLNSTQNNGTANGEDDEAQTYVRTFTFAPERYESANPGQVALPIVRSNQPKADSTKADLSLRMQVSRPSALTGQLVDVSLIVTNQGGLTATNVLLNNVLPSGAVFVSSRSGMTLNGSVLSGSISSIPSGQSMSLTFTVRLTGSGVFTNRAQIMGVTQSDPDSKPGNGYTNGEDDQCSVTLRTSS